MPDKDSKLKVVGPAPPYDEELRLWLESYISAYPHLTTAILSRSDNIGKSRTALDEYLACTYFQPKPGRPEGVKSSKLEDAIRAYRERVEGTVRHGYTNSFVETTSWKQFQHACHTAISENVIVVVYARPGVGKSRCLMEYSVRKLTTGAINILCSANITTRYFVQKLAQAVGLDDTTPTAKLEDLIAAKLKRNPRPIFVDQANYLNEKAMGTICHLWEIARVPVILIGTKDLYEIFTTSRLTEDVRAQLSSRVAMHYPLKDLSLAEVKTIVTRALGKDASEAAIAQIHNITGGIHRHVDMIVPRINELKAVNRDRLSTGEATMEAIINSAGRRLMVG